MAEPKDEGPFGHYPAKWERDSQKRARRAAGRQITTEDRLAYALERSTADHDYEQQQLRAARRAADLPLDMLDTSLEGRIEFSKLHDRLIVDESGVPRLRPDFVRYLDELCHERDAVRAADDAAVARDPARAALAEAWRQLVRTHPQEARVLYHLHVLGQSQSAAAVALGLDRTALRTAMLLGERFLETWVASQIPAAAIVDCPPLRIVAGARGTCVVLVFPGAAGAEREERDA